MKFQSVEPEVSGGGGDERFSKMRVFCAAVLLLFLVVGGGCSSDPDTPLGSEFLEDGRIGGEPGEVIQDTLLVESGDLSFVVGDYLFNSDKLELGRKDDVETWPVLRVNFSPAGNDTLLTVREASLRLVMSETSETLSAIFRELGTELVDSDTLKGISLGDTIPDSTGTAVRTMALATPNYWLPPALVQQWIRKERPRNGIAVVLDDPSDTTRLSFQATERGTSLRPTLKVIFTNSNESTYAMSADGTFARETYSTANLLLSDGVTRRVLIPVDLTAFDANTLVHEAKIVLHYVPDTNLGTDVSVTLYAPETTDTGDPGVLGGTLVSSTVMDETSGVLSFSIRNILSTLIAKGTDENALVLRYSNEGSAIRRVEFYGSGAADSLAPAFNFTYSKAPKFGK
jgi:hypothetical protein